MLARLVMRIARDTPFAKLRAGSYAALANVVWRRNHLRLFHPNDLNSYEDRVYSQHGEDGIIVEILFRLGATRGSFVEMSVGDGRECNTALLARNYGWSGVMIEGGALAAVAIQEYAALPNVRVLKEFVTAENVADVLRATGIPAEFDLLSIDIDGNDYYIWRALRAYRPKVVVIEYNASFVPPLEWIMRYDANHIWDARSWNFGASLAAYEKLATELGYSLVGTESSGTNSFFVRSDLLPLVRFPARSAEACFRAPHRMLFSWLWDKAAATVSGG